MFSTRISTVLVFTFLCIYNIESAPAVSKARQFLPALPGYIPVYIRTGDTPLEDINPELAEAFNSYDRKHTRLSLGRANSPLGDQIHVEITNTPDDNSLLQDLTLDQDNTVGLPSTTNFNQHYHIQKIPKP